MNTGSAKPPVAPKPTLRSAGGLGLASPLLPRAGSSTAKGPKPVVAPKPRVRQDRDPREGGCCPRQEACPNGGPLPLGRAPGWGGGSQCWAGAEAEARATPDPHLQELLSDVMDLRQRDPGNASPALDAGGESAKQGPEDDMMQDSDEDWRSTDASALQDVGGSPDSLGASDAGLVAGSTASVEMTDTDMTEDLTSEGCDAGEALADTDGFSLGDCSCSVGDCSFELGDGSFSVGDCSFASVEEEEELAISSVRGPRPRAKEPLEDGREDSEARCITEPLKVREDMRPANGYGAKYIANVLSVECGSFKGAGSIGPAQNQVLLEVQTKPKPNYMSSEDVVDGRQILMDQKVALLSRSPVIQHKHLLGDSSVVLPSKYRCITDKDSPFRNCRNNEPIESSEDPLDVDDGVVEDKDQERRHNRMNIKGEDHKTWLMNASLDCRPLFRLVSFSVPPDPEASLTSSASEGQLMSPQALYAVRDEDTGEGYRVPFLDDTTDTEQDLSEEHVYEETGPDLEGGPPLEKRSVVPGALPLSRPHLLDPAAPALTSSPMLGPVRARCYSRPPGLSHCPRSVSVEGQDLTLRRGQERDPASRERGDDLFLSHAFSSSGSFSRCPPRPISGLTTPTSLLDIPPPFELACITKRPLTKSSPSLHTDGEHSKKKSSIKRFLMLKFRKKSSDRKPAVDLPSPSSRSSSESINHLTGRSLETDRNALSNFSLVNVCSAGSPRSAARLLPPLVSHGDRRSLAFLSRSVIRVESFEERSRGPLVALALTKPRSISFPNTDSSSDYENVPPLSSDYENVTVPHPPLLGPETFPEFLEWPWRARSAAHDTDGYVDMSSFPGFERRTRAPPEETESAYTEAYKVCSMAVGPPAGLGGAEGPDPGQTSEDEDRGADGNYDRPPDGRSRAFYIAKELMDTERLHVKALKHLQEDFREAVCSAVGADGERVLGDQRLREILTELPDVYSLHRRILGELEDRLRHWEESQSIADVILSKKADFFVFTTFIGHYDRSVSLLEDSCRSSPAFAAIVSQFEQSAACEGVSLKHQLLRVIVRVAQYRMLLTDYLNNLRPDSKEYEDSQAAVAVVSDIADQANDSLQNGENVLRLVNIEYSVRGQNDLLRPGRVFIKEGTLMKVSRKSSQPRHLFLMNDVLLYTYPQQDGKYRLKDTLSLSGMKVTKPSSEETQNALKIEVKDVSISLSASSSSEREDWFYALSRTVAHHSRGAPASTAGHGEDEDHPGGALGERPPRPVCASQVLMCMNCTCDFSLRLRRHHCHACGRIVCRSCSRNRCPLKYLKGRMAKVCDHCYSQLQARGPPGSASSAPTSPRLGRTRPLSAVFQNIHPPNLWRHRKGTASFTPGAVWEEGTISGSLQRSKRSKQHWKRLWFLLKDKVLYTYRAQEEKVASESLPLLGFTVKLADREQQDEANLFQLYHKKTLYYTFRAEDNCTAQRWVNAMEEATVL